jgi:hypothetical protein
MCHDGEASSGTHTLSIRWFWLLAAAAAGPALFGQTDPAFTAKNSSSSATQSFTGKERAAWALRGTFGPASLLGGVISSGWGTVFNTPREYGTHWEGFGDRYGMRLTGIATSNTMEAGLGAIWGEDPRYFRASGESFQARLGHVVKMAFLAPDKDGRVMPAYARYAAITGSNYLSNTWRVDSDATLSRATIRVGLGFLGRIAGNAWDEFWPDVKERISRKSDQPSGASAILHH